MVECGECPFDPTVSIKHAGAVRKAASIVKDRIRYLRVEIRNYVDTVKKGRRIIFPLTIMRVGQLFVSCCWNDTCITYEGRRCSHSPTKDTQPEGSLLYRNGVYTLLLQTYHLSH
jgi:hypothetical protein